MKTVSPSRDKKSYRHRYLFEIFFHALKSFRRIATRYERAASNYLAIVHLACALQWLKQAAWQRIWHSIRRRKLGARGDRVRFRGGVDSRTERPRSVASE